MSNFSDASSVGIDWDIEQQKGHISYNHVMSMSGSSKNFGHDPRPKVNIEFEEEVIEFGDTSGNRHTNGNNNYITEEDRIHLLNPTLTGNSRAMTLEDNQAEVALLYKKKSNLNSMIQEEPIVDRKSNIAMFKSEGAKYLLDN